MPKSDPNAKLFTKIGTNRKQLKKKPMKTAVKIMAALALAGLMFTGCSKSGKQKVPAHDARLENVVWRLTELNGNEVNRPGKYEVTFGADNRVAGIGECNRFFGSYQRTNNSGGITIGPVGSTMILCPDDNYENEFFRMFEDIRLYQFSEDRLFLFAGNEMRARAIFVDSGKTPVTGVE